MTKICSKCKVEKDLNKENFESKKENRDGFHGVCRECRRARKREIYNDKYKSKNTNRFWTEEEVKILKEYYPNTDNSEIQEKYLPNRTITQITDKAIKNLKIKKDKDYSPMWKKEYVQYVKDNYENQDISIEEIAKYVGKSYDSVVYMANKIGLKRPMLQWTEDELNLIKQHYPNMFVNEFIEKHMPYRNKSQIVSFANKNGIVHDNKLKSIIGIQNLKKIKSSNYSRQGMPQLKGEESPLYVERIEIQCSQCSKKIKKRKSDIKNKKNVFCSRKCMGNWMSENCKGENNSNYGNGDAWTDEMRRKKAESSIKSLLKLDNQQIVTKPQKIINELLNKLKIANIKEYNCKYYLLDNYLQDYNLGIEVHGNFFHCNPTMNLKNSREVKIIGKDKSKHTYLKRYMGFETLYLWEYDIINNLELCEKLVLEYIEYNGKLVNYHSFNYELIDNKLNLKEELIPFHY